MYASKIAAATLTSLLAAAVPAQAPSPEGTLPRAADLSLHDLLEQVLDQYPGYEQIEPRLNEAARLGNKADSLISGSPSIEVGYRTGEVGNNANLREYEAGLNLPLWRWGQRSASRVLADESSREARGFSLALRWQLAGALREALWRIELGEARRAEALRSKEISADLERAVRRRVELGDLPRSDLLQAEQDLLTSELRVVEMSSAYRGSVGAYEVLTGLETLPGNLDEPLSEKKRVSEDHPLLALSRARLDRARAEFELARETGSDTPSLFVGTISERGGDDESFEDSVGIALSYPIGGRHLRAEVATERVRLAEERAEHRSVRKNLEAAYREALTNLDRRRSELDLAKTRDELAARHLEMTRAAFDLGDIDLMDFLRIKNIAVDARTAAREKDVLWRKAIADFNQAVGELP